MRNWFAVLRRCVFQDSGGQRQLWRLWQRLWPEQDLQARDVRRRQGYDLPSVSFILSTHSRTHRGSLAGCTRTHAFPFPFPFPPGVRERSSAVAPSASTRPARTAIVVDVVSSVIAPSCVAAACANSSQRSRQTHPTAARATHDAARTRSAAAVLARPTATIKRTRTIVSAASCWFCLRRVLASPKTDCSRNDLH